MSTVRFRAGSIGLELRGSEAFVTRQLRWFAPYLGRVDGEALAEPRTAQNDAQADEGERLDPAAAPVVVEQFPAPAKNGGQKNEPHDELRAFFNSFAPSGRDRQADAALLFAYFLQRREGRTSLGVGDLIRCCIRVGVDTRNFNRVLGTLTRRGLLETVRHGHAYLISDQGVAAVEGRMS